MSDSEWRLELASLPPAWREEWEERASIVEFLGARSREDAERQAYEMVKHRIAKGER